MTSSSYKHLLSTASLKKGAVHAGVLSTLYTTKVKKDWTTIKSRVSSLSGFKADEGAEQNSNCHRRRFSLSTVLTDSASICPLAVNPVVFLDGADLDSTVYLTSTHIGAEQSLLCLILLALSHTGPPTPPAASLSLMIILSF